jgi:hypothetical protein
MTMVSHPHIEVTEDGVAIPPEEKANLLAVTQVLTELRYNEDAGLLSVLLTVLGGAQIMLESPLVESNWLAKEFAQWPARRLNRIFWQFWKPVLASSRRTSPTKSNR